MHTVPTERNLTPEQTQSKPRVRSLGSFWVRSELAFKNVRSLWFALGSLQVRSLGALYALTLEADPIFILPPVSPLYTVKR
jgi:hypothetical protein